MPTQAAAVKFLPYPLLCQWRGYGRFLAVNTNEPMSIAEFGQLKEAYQRYKAKRFPAVKLIAEVDRGSVLE
jgi:hypothetical protein